MLTWPIDLLVFCGKLTWPRDLPLPICELTWPDDLLLAMLDCPNTVDSGSRNVTLCVVLPRTLPVPPGTGLIMLTFGSKLPICLVAVEAMKPILLLSPVLGDFLSLANETTWPRESVDSSLLDEASVFDSLLGLSELVLDRFWTGFWTDWAVKRLTRGLGLDAISSTNMSWPLVFLSAKINTNGNMLQKNKQIQFW